MVLYRQCQHSGETMGPCLSHPGSVWTDLPAHPPQQPLWEKDRLLGQGPTPTTYLSLCRKFPVLGEAEGKAAEDTGRKGRLPVTLRLALSNL